MEDITVHYSNITGKSERKDLFVDLWELIGKY
jgi:hypothetical protein